MQIKLLTMWNGQPAGKVLNVGRGVGALLVGRKIAVMVDEDGIDTAKLPNVSGVTGTVKAFLQPNTTPFKKKGK